MFHENRSKTSHVILFTDKHTYRRTDIGKKPNVPGGGKYMQIYASADVAFIIAELVHMPDVTPGLYAIKNINSSNA